MRKQKTTAKKAAKKPEKSLEESLWETATKLRGSVESSDWNEATETDLGDTEGVPNNG